MYLPKPTDGTTSAGLAYVKKQIFVYLRHALIYSKQGILRRYSRTIVQLPIFICKNTNYASIFVFFASKPCIFE